VIVALFNVYLVFLFILVKMKIVPFNLFWKVSPLKLDDANFAASLPAGTAGTAAIYTSHIKPFYIIRKVILRQIAIVNYVNPFCQAATCNSRKARKAA